MIIYCITCVPTGMRYVGQTTKDLNVRWKNHCTEKSHSTYLSNAIKKYGKENFEIKEIAHARSIEELNELEKSYIILLGTLSPNGYNLTEGGDRTVFSQDTIIKMSKSQTGRKHKPETIEKFREAHKRRTPEQREKQSKMITEYNKKREFTPEMRSEMSKRNKGKKLTQEQKEKISNSMKGYKNHFYGKHHSEETRKRLSEKRKNQPNPRKGCKHSPKSMENISNGHKKRALRRKNYLKLCFMVLVLNDKSLKQLKLFNEE